MLKSQTTTAAPPRTLREAIARSGLSDDQLIIKLGCTKRTLTNWRNGARPRDYYIGLLSKILECDLWALYGTTAENAESDEQGSTTPHILIKQDILHLFIDRSIGQHSSHIDDSMQRYLSRQLDQLWEAFHATDTLAGIATQRIALMGHIHALESLAAWPLRTSDQLWITQSLCEAAILAGRIARDQMNYQEAITQHKRAMQLALECRSSDHIAAATMRLVETLWDAGLPYEAASYCQAGLAQSQGANPRIRGELMGFAAEIFGSIGDLRKSERLTNEAAHLAIGATHLPTAGGINFSETAAASYQMDDALRRGDTAAALTHITRARSLLAIEFPIGHNIRWKAHLWINQARAQSEAGEIEAACSDLQRAAHLAQSINSQIALKKVQDAARTLTQRVRLPMPAITSLHEELMEIIVPRSRG